MSQFSANFRKRFAGPLGGLPDGRVRIVGADDGEQPFTLACQIRGKALFIVNAKIEISAPCDPGLTIAVYIVLNRCNEFVNIVLFTGGPTDDYQCCGARKLQLAHAHNPSTAFLPQIFQNGPITIDFSDNAPLCLGNVWRPHKLCIHGISHETIS